MEIELPNKNYLPLHCKALYRFDHTGIGDTENAEADGRGSPEIA